MTLQSANADACVQFGFTRLLMNMGYLSNEFLILGECFFSFYCPCSSYLLEHIIGFNWLLFNTDLYQPALP